MIGREKELTILTETLSSKRAKNGNGCRNKVS